MRILQGLGAGLAAALVVAVSPVAAAPRSQLTPLADANLFISPCGAPYRSKPGEPYPVVAWFKNLDVNHDGKVDRAEFRAEAEAFFHQLDLRKNGVVDDQIIGLYEKQLVPEILVGAGGAHFTGGASGLFTPVLAQIPNTPIDPGPAPDIGPVKPRYGEGPPQGAAAYSLLNDPEPLRSADRSFIGRIKLEDMLAQSDRNFDALDPDGRGYLLLEELPRTPVQRVAAVAKPPR